MARFDVFPNASGLGYLLSVQSDLLEQLSTVVVVPLLPVSQAPRPAARLNPKFEVLGVPVVMVTQFMAAVPARELGTALCSLSRERALIADALDFLHQGW